MFDVLAENLKKCGYEVSRFETAEEAAAYLDSAIDAQTVGMGGSVTLAQLNLSRRLETHNTLYWHQGITDKNMANEIRTKAATADVFLSSVNAIAETGEIINIDGHGNRVASILYGHKKVYLVVGKNKIEKDFEGALHRARNVAAPKNAQRLGVNTPCAARADRCYDCQSPQRICRALSVLWQKPTSAEFEIVLIHENLGY